MKPQPQILNDFLTLALIILIISPIPIIPGVSTLSVVPIIIVFLSLLNGYFSRIYLDKNILIFAFLYALLVVLSTEVILEDENYRLMYLSTLIITLYMSFIKLRGLNARVLILSVIFFVSLVSLNADILFTSIFLEETRVDVLNWQKESSFIYGINKFLLGIYVLCIIFCISDIKNKYKLAMILSYLSFSFFLGSRSHSILSITLLILNEMNLSRTNIISNIIIVAKGLAVSIIVIFMIGYFFDYGIILERAHRFIFDFSGSKRGIILESFVSCFALYAQLIGHDVLSCTQNVTSDLDNTFAFVLASSGYIAFICSIILFAWSYVLLRKSGLNNKWVIYILASLLVLLSVDILVYRPIILLPLFIYIIGIDKSKHVKHRISYIQNP